jgi:hypothetical protein
MHLHLDSLCLTWSDLDSDALTWIHYDVSFSQAWLIIVCSACICKACLRLAFFFNKAHVGCLCPMSGSSLSSCILTWIRFVSLALSWSQLGLIWSHLDSQACFFSDAWLVIWRSACICKACLRQAFFFNSTHVGCMCSLSGSCLSSGIFTWIRFVSLALSRSQLGLRWSSLDSLSRFFFGRLACHLVLGLYL